MILNVYKEKGLTSRQVCNIIGKHFKTRHVGHAGTLDPLATGVLVVLTDKDTKEVNNLILNDKEYKATMQMRLKTDTGDITGNIIGHKDYNVNKEQIVDVLNSFKGQYIQEVPLYSAVKVNGRRLYEYARKGIPVELPKREVFIYDIKLIDYHDDIIVFTAKVSKGTYIRVLIEDIATKLNTYGTMIELERIKAGKFSVEDAIKISDIIK